jgi:plastocyanin
MGRLSYLTTLLVIGLLVGVTSAVAQSNQQDTVSIRDFSFEPAQLSVEPGTTVTWTNEGNEPHTVTADNGLFDSRVLNPGESYSVQFDGMGTVTYYCTLHPSMRGRITVGGGVPSVTEQPAMEQPATDQPVIEQPATTGGY